MADTSRLIEIPRRRNKRHSEMLLVLLRKVAESQLGWGVAWRNRGWPGIPKGGPVRTSFLLLVMSRGVDHRRLLLVGSPLDGFIAATGLLDTREIQTKGPRLSELTHQRVGRVSKLVKR